MLLNYHLVIPFRTSIIAAVHSIQLLKLYFKHIDCLLKKKKLIKLDPEIKKVLSVSKYLVLDGSHKAHDNVNDCLKESPLLLRDTKNH